MHAETLLKEFGVPRDLELFYHYPASDTQVSIWPDSALGDAFRLTLALHYLERSRQNVEELTYTTSHLTELTAIAPMLEDLFDFLTNTRVSLRFERAIGSTQSRLIATKASSEVILFSGGLDSFCGSVIQDSKKILAHCVLNEIVYGRTRALREKCSTLQGFPMVICQGVYQALTGGISQTRGLLFLMFAGLVSETLGSTRIIFAENGPLMINPETSSISLPTRNSDPRLVVECDSILTKLTNGSVRICCPFKDLTKSEVVASTPKRYHSIFPLTNSCHSTRSRGMCGICFGCFVRRLSLAAAKCDALDSYACDVFLQDLSEFGAQRKSRVLDLRQSLRFFRRLVTENKLEYENEQKEFFDDPTAMLKRFGLDLLLGLRNLFESHPSYRTHNTFGRYCATIVNETSRELIDHRAQELQEILEG